MPDLKKGMGQTISSRRAVSPLSSRAFQLRQNSAARLPEFQNSLEGRNPESVQLVSNEAGLVPELFLDAEQLIIFADAVCAAA